MHGNAIQGLLDLMRSQDVRENRRTPAALTHNRPGLDRPSNYHGPIESDTRELEGAYDRLVTVRANSRAPPLWHDHRTHDPSAASSKQSTSNLEDRQLTRPTWHESCESHRAHSQSSLPNWAWPSLSFVPRPLPHLPLDQAKVTPNSSPFFQPFNPSGPTAKINSSQESFAKDLNAAHIRLPDETQPLPNPPKAVTSASNKRKPDRAVPLPALHATRDGPVVNGVRLIAISALPDRLQQIFAFKLLNAVQSKCFSHVFETDDNFVMSAPTGSGKTTIFELAICRLALSCQDNYKVIYMAPTRSLCSERARDWQSRFRLLNLTCSEITGDTTNLDSGQKIQAADIIITTPEKWDSMTRKWKDHRQVMLAVKLLLIDETHMLGESRGATLEVIVSRMKSMGSEARFIALSATIPNISDIAEWLGRNQHQPDTSAPIETFGEEYRPVKLERHVHELKEHGNMYHIDAACDRHLPDIIHQHSKRQPILIFCSTKKSCEGTAKLLKEKRKCDARAEAWWPMPQEPMEVESPEMTELLASGVAYHHAGLKTDEREAIEAGFCDGHIFVICCTSTLAVGVNLPCYLVIIKNTQTFCEEGPREYNDLEIMQMLGRAGRPRYQSAGAVAVIITLSSRADRYRRLVAGEVPVESSLHLSLIEHMNAEIGLGTVKSLLLAQSWLKSTFLYVRLRRNPDHYKIKHGANLSNLEERVAAICQREIKLLTQEGLVTSSTAGEGESLTCTPLGDAMARYYVQFSSMKTLLKLPRESELQAILSILTQADELSRIHLRQTELKRYQEINRGNLELRFRADEIATRAHKAFVITQMELAGCNPLVDGRGKRIDGQYLQDRNLIFSNLPRLVRCVIDCHIHFRDAVTVRNGLELARSLSCRMWDDAPTQLQLIDGIGPVFARKLASAGITSIEMMRDSDLAKIAMVTGRRADAGKFWHGARSYPIPRISVSMCRHNDANPVLRKVHFSVQVGFLNSTAPDRYNKKPIYLCVVAERSDGQLIDFKRVRANRVNEPIFLEGEMSSPTQFIKCCVMCEELVGTLRHAVLYPDIPEAAFDTNSASPHGGLHDDNLPGLSGQALRRHGMPVGDAVIKTGRRTLSEQLRDLDDIDEADLVAAEAEVTMQRANADLELTTESTAKKPNNGVRHRLPNGKFECNHGCKDKMTCRHLCCREGLDQPPRQNKTSGKEKGSKKKLPQESQSAQKTDQHRLLSGKRETAASMRRPANSARKRLKMNSHTPSSPRQPLVSIVSRNERQSLLAFERRDRKRKAGSPLDSGEEVEDVDMLLGAMHKDLGQTASIAAEATKQTESGPQATTHRSGKFSNRFEGWLH